MCSICGEINFIDEPSCALVKDMNQTMKHRGPDSDGIFLDNNVSFGHNRLCVIDIENGAQPMSVFYGNKKYTIVYNGEIYNCDEIRKDIKKQGIELKTNCDTEVVLYSYILYGEDAPKTLVVYDPKAIREMNGYFSAETFDLYRHWTYVRTLLRSTA